MKSVSIAWPKNSNDYEKWDHFALNCYVKWSLQPVAFYTYWNNNISNEILIEFIGQLQNPLKNEHMVTAVRAIQNVIQSI